MTENTNAREDTLRNVDTPQKSESEVAEHISREKANLKRFFPFFLIDITVISFDKMMLMSLKNVSICIGYVTPEAHTRDIGYNWDTPCCIILSL